jgi:hypothetical protein
MRGVSGGSLPAEIWRKVMIAAHGDLPASDFDAVTAEGGAADAPGAGADAASATTREGFYQTLAAEFDRAAKQ